MLETLDVEKRDEKRGRTKNKKMHFKWSVPYEGRGEKKATAVAVFLQKECRRMGEDSIRAIIYTGRGVVGGRRLVAVALLAPFLLSRLLVCNKASKMRLAANTRGDLGPANTNRNGNRGRHKRTKRIEAGAEGELCRVSHGPEKERPSLLGMCLSLPFRVPSSPIRDQDNSCDIPKARAHDVESCAASFLLSSKDAHFSSYFLPWDRGLVPCWPWHPVLRPQNTLQAAQSPNPPFCISTLTT